MCKDMSTKDYKLAKLRFVILEKMAKGTFTRCNDPSHHGPSRYAHEHTLPDNSRNWLFRDPLANFWLSSLPQRCVSPAPRLWRLRSWAVRASTGSTQAGRSGGDGQVRQTNSISFCPYEMIGRVYYSPGRFCFSLFLRTKFIYGYWDLSWVSIIRFKKKCFRNNLTNYTFY